MFIDADILSQIDSEAPPLLVPLAALDLRELAAHRFKQRELLLAPCPGR